jgi:hypothetical protein
VKNGRGIPGSAYDMNHGGDLVRYSLMPSAQKSPHYGALLVVLLILLVVAPMVHDRVGYGVELFFDLVLIVGAYSAAWQSRHRVPFLALTIVTLAMRWADMALGHVGFSPISIALLVLWLTYAASLIFVALFRMEKVSTNAILGAIVAYVLSAIAFASCFELIERLQPSSFSGLPVGSTAADVGSALLYFSIVSITTMGYGDILPVSELARSVASLEGVFGTLYLAVMIARLVGLHGQSGDAA